MADPAVPAPPPPAEGSPEAAASRMHPGQLLAYYSLLFVFITLTRLLLGELGARFDLRQFEKVSQLISHAVNPAWAFDDVAHTLFSLLLAFLITLPIAWVYTMTKEGDLFDASLVQTIVVLAMVVTAVMIVIGSELARAFSLAGVVAAVRFRNTLDDAKDAVYIFIALAIGMACGTRAYHIAVWISVVMTGTIFLLWRFHFGTLLRTSTPSALAVKSRKKKGKDDAGLPLLAADAQQRIEQAVEQRYRLVQWASMVGPDKNDKRPNAGIVVGAADVQRAQGHVETALSALGGSWQLANLVSDGEAGGTLEYVGRLPKNVAASALLEGLQRDAAAAGISEIQFYTLKGLRAPAGAYQATEAPEA